MKKLILIILCVFCFKAANAQDKVFKNNEVAVIAEPYEGIALFYQTVAKQINVVNPAKLPAEKVDFRVFFVVEKDGSFSDFNVEGISFGYAENVISTLKQMPKWKPAVYNNENVRSQMVFPVTLIDSKAKK
ncbi:hypothetical protein [Paenimyroides baculatum]|uniref:TonB protein C-terminal n=1 Tax=Paenimyroides baculatum TaxID=2608000 RepID=A0A5M6CTF7_9FLAO|nr:hypothetical protein [Paenimyroides baculatum]KAA5538226.1 hypothetical protein F0460_01085 [Paenimyroides baculatum]